MPNDTFNLYPKGGVMLFESGDYISAKVAVIMPMYNAENTIERAVDSVINQSYNNWILYIINDASTDLSMNILGKYKEDKRIVVVNNFNNLGVAESRNKGLDISKEDIVCFLDSDDEWVSNKLSVQLSMLNTSPMVISFYKYVTDKNCRLVTTELKNITLHDLLSKKFRVCFSSLMINRKGLNVRFQNIGHEDFLYLINLLSHITNGVVVPTSLVNYYVTRNSLSSNKIKAILWQYKILKIVFPFNFFNRIFYMANYAFNGIKFR